MTAGTSAADRTHHQYRYELCVGIDRYDDRFAAQQLRYPQELIYQLNDVPFYDSVCAEPFDYAQDRLVEAFLIFTNPSTGSGRTEKAESPVRLLDSIAEIPQA